MLAQASGRSTLVLDIGKSNARLLLIDDQGQECWHSSCANQAEERPDLGYLALGVQRLSAWLDQTLSQLGRRLAQPGSALPAPARLICTTHGAAFCALGTDGVAGSGAPGGLLLPPVDYEWDGYGDVTAGFEASLANFSHHGTPRLPQGLNAGRQLDWLQRRHPQRLQGLRCWLPYPQFWAWWFSGAAVSEVSSLGCHTGLWAPDLNRYSDWAQASGLAERFAPRVPAWQTVGSLRPALALAWGLPPELQVLAGVHDSNACLARHLRSHPDATVVSTGTWTVVMAPGAPTQRLVPEHDELVNVAVDGRAVPTARFMGGREFAALCAGADPALATDDALAQLLAQGWSALPAWSDSGGPFVGRRGQVLRDGQPQPEGVLAVPQALRPALAALYCARMCQLLIDELRTDGRPQPPLSAPAAQAADASAALPLPQPFPHPPRLAAGQGADCAAASATAVAAGSAVILEGPLAHNQAFGTALAAALGPERPLLRCVDPVEGTARGAWMLAHWQQAALAASAPPLQPVAQPAEPLRAALAADAARWTPAR